MLQVNMNEFKGIREQDIFCVCVCGVGGGGGVGGGQIPSERGLL